MRRLHRALDGQAIRSCITPVSSVGAAKVVTLAGLGTPEKPHPLQTAYIEEQVPQCGYCINGWIMTAAAFLANKKKPTDAEIKGGARRRQVPLRHARQHSEGGQARRGDDGLRESTMTKMEKPTTLSRRAVLMGAGALVVSVGAPVGIELLTGMRQAFAQGAKPPLTPEQLSSYIAVNADGTVSAFFGKMDMGHGLFVAIGQIVAEELDVPFKAVKVYMGDTATSVNQGGASGSTGIQFGGKQMRMAAAEARRVLLEMAAAKLGTPADQLIVVDGAVSAAFNRDKKTSYAELIGGKYFNVQLDWNKQMGNALYAPGKAQPKKHNEHKIVGKPIKREDVAPKVFAQEDFCTDIKVPGMVHGRMIRPAVAGSAPVKIDESSIKDIPGAQGGHQNGLPRRVAPQGVGRDQGDREAQGRVVQGRAAVPEPERALRPHPQGAGAQERRLAARPPATSTRRSRPRPSVIEAEYEWPFQSHAAMGPACAVVEIKDGKVKCWTGSQKSHFVRVALPAQLGVPLDNVHVIWQNGPGSYGRNDADDCAADCAALAKAVGKPVRLQYTRDQGTGWDPKGPASIHRARAAIDAQGNVIAYEFTSKGFSRVDVNTNGSKLSTRWRATRSASS